jgi:phenylalanyl-tRNA synthetase alpha chain
MGEFSFTVGQKQRLLELGAGREDIEASFDSEIDREENFKRFSSDLTRVNIGNLEDFIQNRKKPLTRIIEEKIRAALVGKGFCEVSTPIIISRPSIEKMGINESDPLWQQIFWLNSKECLRPMLAPNLYIIMEKLYSYIKPVRIFEIGQCFRHDTKGPMHLEEFTMLNLVELDPKGDLRECIMGDIKTVMDSIGMRYEISSEGSDVYGETLDVVINGLEMASAAIGPKPMDANWGVFTPWVGVGFGIERLAMLYGNYNSATRVSRSLIYLDGSRLNLK